MTTQEVLADFITKTTISDIDQLAIERGRAAIVDSVGVAYVGSLTPIGKSLRCYLQASGDFRSDASTLLIGATERSSPANAALYNATVAHALDFDDYSHPGNAHLTCSLLGALISVFTDDALFSDDFLCAYSVGYEAAAKVGRVLTRYKRGAAWHPTGVLGPIGCAAAVANALKLDRTQTMHTLGISASCAASVRANFGSMTKPMHAGRSAQAGVMAGMLAREGYDASADAFDGKTGFFRAFGTAEPDVLAKDVETAMSELGHSWEIASAVGIQLKPWPCASVTNGGAEAALRIAQKVDYRDIADIYIGLSEQAEGALLPQYRMPEEGLQGKFSPQFCVAAALRWHQIRLETFTDKRVRDQDIRALIEKTTLAIDDRVKDDTEHATVVEVTLQSGEKFVEIVNVIKGKAANWMTRDEQLEKFSGTAGVVLGTDAATSMFDSMFGSGSQGGNDVAAYLTTVNPTASTVG